MKKKIIKWEEKIIYQIFPRSFKDSNNDGNGDLKGIIKKIPYLKQLGITAIWLCPIYDTKFVDAGYDVLNYKKVWKKFGTLLDFQALTLEAKKADIDIIMDIVLNHTSSEHEWFKKALASEKNIEHNYFIWREKLSKDEKKAQSIFGGSAWEYVPELKKYYFHLFSKNQVDLNWEHPDTISAMSDVIDFWYKLGVRGFRLDAIKHIAKTFPEGNNNAHSWGKNVVPWLQKFNKQAFKNKPDVFILGEASGITLKDMLKYGKGKDKVAQNYYNFSWWAIGWGRTGRNGFSANWHYTDFAKNMEPFQNSKDVTPKLMTNFLSNHDTSRAISRWGDENVFWTESAKSMALMLFAIKGIPCIYYGEEIGMLNPRFPDRKSFRDIDALNAYELLVDIHKTYSEEEMTKYHNVNSRDNCRTPMQWNSKINAGFNEGHKTWIKVGDHFEDINVKSQVNNPHSILNFYKELIKTRKSKITGDVLVYGISKLEISKTKVFKITRTYKGKKIITFINMAPLWKEFMPPKGAQVLHTTYRDVNLKRQELRPHESIMFIK